MSPYGLAKENKKRTLKLYIIPPAAGVAYATAFHCKILFRRPAGLELILGLERVVQINQKVKIFARKF